MTVSDRKNDEFLRSYVSLAALAGRSVRGNDLMQQAAQVLRDRYRPAYTRLLWEPLPGSLHGGILSCVFHAFARGPSFLGQDGQIDVAGEIRRFERRMRRINQWLAAFRRRKPQWDELINEINRLSNDEIKIISGGAAHDRRGVEWWLFTTASGNPRRARRILRNV